MNFLTQDLGLNEQQTRAVVQAALAGKGVLANREAVDAMLEALATLLIYQHVATPAMDDWQPIDEDCYYPDDDS